MQVSGISAGERRRRAAACRERSSRTPRSSGAPRAPPPLPKRREEVVDRRAAGCARSEAHASIVSSRRWRSSKPARPRRRWIGSSTSRRTQPAPDRRRGSAGRARAATVASSSASRRGAVDGPRRGAARSSCVGAGRRPRVGGPGARGTRASVVPSGSARRSATSVAPARPSDRSPQVVEDDLAALAIEVDVQPAGRNGKSVLDLVDDGPRRAIDDRAQAILEAELASVLADQVDNGQMALAVGPTQAAAELLGENRGRGGRPQQEHGSRRRERRRPRREPRRRRRTAARPASRSLSAAPRSVGCVVASQRDALERRLGELARHVVRVLLRDAEAQRAHRVRLEHDRAEQPPAASRPGGRRW